MFQHIVLLRLRDVDEAFLAAVAGHVTRLKAGLPFLRSYDFVRNAARRASGYDWAVVAIFENAGDHQRYQVSDIHKHFEGFMAPHIEDLIVLDAELPA